MKEIHVISLGAGVQSSTMALMAAHGEITPLPIGAIFADTLSEPGSVYGWMDWLKMILPFPIYRVSQGKGLAEDALRIRQRKDGKGQWSRGAIPHFIVNGDGSLGQGPRQCRRDFKIAPIQRKIRQLQLEHGGSHCIEWIGISLEEAHRMKPARVGYVTNIWPLIDRRMTRADCLEWIKKNGYPEPPRSACIFCPYHSDREWRRLKDEEPEEFQKAIEFEKAYQRVKAKTGVKNRIPYLHASRIALEEVDFSTDFERGQLEFIWQRMRRHVRGVISELRAAQ